MSRPRRRRAPVAAIGGAVTAAALVSGCGSSGHASRSATTLAQATASAQATPSTQATPSAQATTSAQTATSAQTTTAHHSAESVAAHHASHGSRYGKLPSWLPSAKPPRQTLQHASFSHPVLTIQGDGLVISVPRAKLHAIAVGPSVPEIGKTPVPPTSPVTFVVTFSDVTAPVALRPSSFVLIDEDHHVHFPRVTALDGGPAPTALRPGPPVSIKLHSVLPTGDGGLEWRPDGGRAVAGWDFNVEID